MSPILFTIPGLDWEVSAYGFFLGLALVVGWLLSLRLAAKDRLPTDRLGTGYVLCVGAALLGARAVWLLLNSGSYEGIASFVTFAQGGLHAPAALVIAVVVAIVHTNALELPTWVWLDATATSLAAGVALERIGALLGGLGFGRHAPEFPLALQFPAGSPAFEAHRRGLAQLMPPGATQSLPVYPTQLIAAALAVIALVWALRRRRTRTFAGEIALAVGAWLVAARAFVEEPLRADRADATFGPLSTGQVLAIVVVAALAWTWRSRRAAGATAKGAKPWEGGPWTPK